MSYEEQPYLEQKADADSQSLLHALLEAEAGSYVSGSLLAEQLGVSRPAIHGKLDKLREAGFEIEAVRNRGYRLKQFPPVIHPALLSCYLERAGSDMALFYYPEIDSTNNEAERRAASGQAAPFAVVSSCQTRGRGRLGREWHSASAESLYLSVLFRPNIPPQQLQHFTLWAGICICRALQGYVPEMPLQIKWPNDLQCQSRKFAGMLTEAKMDADYIRSIIFGIGLNINSNPNEYPAGIRSRATSLYAMHGEELPINAIAASVIMGVEEAYEICICNPDTEDLVAAWAPLDALAGQSVTAIVSGNEVSGLASGIDASGALLLQMPDGAEQPVRAGDVTLKK